MSHARTDHCTPARFSAQVCVVHTAAIWLVHEIKSATKWRERWPADGWERERDDQMAPLSTACMHTMHHRSVCSVFFFKLTNNIFSYNKSINSIFNHNSSVKQTEHVYGVTDGWTAEEGEPSQSSPSMHASSTNGRGGAAVRSIIYWTCHCTFFVPAGLHYTVSHWGSPLFICFPLYLEPRLSVPSYCAPLQCISLPRST